MSKIILVTGGSRSGKSSFAQGTAETISEKKVFIATCPSIDPEMDDRIQKHRDERRGKGWDLCEEEHDLVSVVEKHFDYDVILIDCMTLWINNLMYFAEKENKNFSEDGMSEKCNALLHACRKHSGTILFVTNEVGSGIIPESATVRLYRDLVGRCNQILGKAADQVILVTCGVPLYLKK